MSRKDRSANRLLVPTGWIEGLRGALQVGLFVVAGALLRLCIEALLVAIFS